MTDSDQKYEDALRPWLRTPPKPRKPTGLTPSKTKRPMKA